MSRKITLAVLVVCSLALTAAVAQATPINLIQNGGFESPALSLASYPGGSGAAAARATYWHDNGDSGADSGISVGSTTATATSTVPGPYLSSEYGRYPTHGGNQVGCFYWYLTQQLTTDGSTPFTFGAAGDVLDVSLYQIRQLGGEQKLQIQLRADSLGGPTLGASTIWSTGTAAPDGVWNRTFGYTAVAGDVGRPLWLRLDNTTHANLSIDDVTVSFTPIPEPSTLALLAAGLLGLLCYAWRKRR
ncbi:MAG: PEP-CTERM sorting domain-containing protein [Planctomycetes bacterium]|nr:PEP-CTERM sorting domain-containing protein [Planctomycetota bacterium]MBU4398070.1 PEP-CTERM sorting domain-containing protein [Planctomycetota bacterium]